ncbi:hypothetical protein V1639_14420 [Pseudarthrobacter sp. J75]|uniref:hypothetical protein n=1 Tax=unclassified Pseudarthrobacter TaxID=2647000 RepID=UPI002E805A65|nr:MULTISPECIES: hypothetical protein [unclassified Pseudarthrobacter]MEE2524177.1 hypothetical protein [Pseudarthrobacter sp. J47]MEE2530215.1 hypothetical protein [Pseudarthrobacter sp. J75]
MLSRSNATIPALAKGGRLQGYKDALEAAGIQFDPGLGVAAHPPGLGRIPSAEKNF